MSAETLFAGLAAAVIELARQVVEAIKVGDRERAAELAEEAARRQALIILRRAKSAHAQQDK